MNEERREGKGKKGRMEEMNEGNGASKGKQERNRIIGIGMISKNQLSIIQ